MTKTPTKKTGALKEKMSRWMSCGRCSVSHSTDDEDRHRVICSDEQRNEDDDDVIAQNAKHSHSLICRNLLLTAPIHLMNGDSHCKSWIRNFVFLHPDTMNAIGSSEMALGRPVVIDNRFGFRMFPDSSVPLTSIGCHKRAIERLQKSPGDWTTLGTALEHEGTTDKIHLQFTEELPPQIRRELNLNEFKADFFEENDSRLFYVGERLKFRFLNNDFSMIVRCIRSGTIVLDAMDDHSTSDVVESFSQLEISSSEESDLKRDALVVRKTFFGLDETHTLLVITHAGPCFTLNSFGGYSPLKTKVLHWLEEVLNGPPQYIGLGAVLSLRLLLLVGLPGVGKTMFVRALANTSHVTLFTITPEIIQDESSLVRLERQIASEGPCIVFFDNLDVICPMKEKERVHHADEFIGHLLKLNNRIFIFGATNKREEVDKYILRSGRFEITQAIDLPEISDKIDIMNRLLLSMKHSLREEDIVALATKTHHFSGLDLSCLCDKAKARSAKSRLLPPTSSSSSSFSDCLDSPSFCRPLTMDDFLHCLPTIEPHLLKTLYQEMPFLKRVELRVTWDDDVVGHRDIKEYGYWCTRHRIDHPKYYERRPQLRHLNGLLLFGASGCSKTMAAKAIANDWQFNFFFVEGNTMAGKYVGSTEANIEKLFNRARQLNPTLIFFDNVESLAMKRNSDGQTATNSRILNQMLVELDRNKGSEEIVAVIAATSRPEQLDPAFYRCGRFDKVVYMPLPDSSSRREILLRKMTSVDDVVLLEELTRRTKGHSHAEIIELVEAAKLEQKEGERLCLSHFEKVFPKIQAKATPERIAVLDAFDKQHGH